MLVYEYMEQGNLHDNLFNKVHVHCSHCDVLLKLSLSLQKDPPLTWRQRSMILKDVCRGLVWLHGGNPRVVHGDIKAYV